MKLRTLLIGLVAFVSAGLATPILAAPERQAEEETRQIDFSAVLTISVVITDGITIEVPVMLNGVVSTTGNVADVQLAPLVDLAFADWVDVEAPQMIEAMVRGSASRADEPMSADRTWAVTANRNANVRTGPGTGYAVAGSVAAGDELVVVGSNEDGSWLALVNGTWIAAFLVDGAPEQVPTVTPTMTPQPSAMPQPTATLRPTATATAVTIQSKGLGATREQIEAEFGKPNEMGGTYLYRDNAVFVIYEEGRAVHFEYSFDKVGYQPLADAKAAARMYMPRDAELVDEYVSDRDRLIEVFHSDAVAAAMPDMLYGSGVAGEFIVLYRVYDGIVHSIVVAMGNNP